MHIAPRSKAAVTGAQPSPQLSVVDLSEPLKRTASAVSTQPLAALFESQVSFLQLDQTPLPGRLDCSRHPGTHPGDQTRGKQ